MPKAEFKEAFLHYVWQTQYFDKTALTSCSGEDIQVHSPGICHFNAGPDFLNARLLLDNIEWHGTVEIHYKSSDWIRHAHQTDKAYNNVVLHVVWQQDEEIKREDGTPIPTLELKSRVDKRLISSYKTLVESKNPIPCGKALLEVDTIYVLAQLERCLLERLQEKAAEIVQVYNGTNYNWEETMYKWIGKCYGFKINSEAFLRLCEVLPYSLLKKYLHHPLQTEALLFGVAGFLKEHHDAPYFQQLRKEYHYLEQKHDLKSLMQREEWKFLRLRPANFPTIRIAQFSSFLRSNKGLYDFVMGSEWDVFDSLKKLMGAVNPFWDSHFLFSKESSDRSSPKQLGVSSAENLVMNALLPLRFAYAHHIGHEEMKEQVLEQFRLLKPEQNHSLDKYVALGFKPSSAFETQALMQLHNVYCQKKQCLSCQIGRQIIYPNRSL
jgi:hypothetical protein